MKRIIMTVVGTLLVAVAGIAGLAYWVGFQIETQYQTYLDRKATESNLNLRSVHYQRGWFTSHVTTELQIANDEAINAKESIHFSLRHRIFHGLLPIGWWFDRGDFSLQPVQAIVRTVLEGEAAWLDRLKTLYPDQEPLVVISRIYLDGSGHHELFMPSLDITDQPMLNALAFSGLHGQFHTTPAGEVTRGAIGVAALRMVGKGQTAGKVIRLRNLRFAVDQRRGRFQFMVGNSILRLDELWLENVITLADFITLAGITLSSKTTEQETSLNADLQLVVEKMAVNDQSVGRGQLHLSLTGLDGALLRQIQQWSQHQMLDKANTESGRMDEILPLFQGLLAQHPALNLETQVNAYQGTLELATDMVLQEFSQIRLQDPRTLLQVLARATAEISISKTLLERILRNLLKAQLRSAALAQEQAIDEPSLERYATVQVQQQMTQLVNSGFIEIDEDRYKISGRYADGRLVINGMRIPLWF